MVGSTDKLTSAQSYRVLLNDEFERRSRHNGQYSLRAFARDLNIAPSRLSEVLNRKKGLSRATAERIAQRLELSPLEKEYFVALVEKEHARSKLKKELARKKVESLAPRFKTLTCVQFEKISEWYHNAILELTYLEDFTFSAKYVAKKLDISPSQAKFALKRLLDLRLIVKHKQRYRPHEDRTAVPSGKPSLAIKRYHEQVLSKAQEALYRQSVQNRDFSSMTLCFDRDKLPEAKQLILEFRRKFSSLFGNRSTQGNAIYCLNTQLFRLDNTNKPKEKK